MIRQIYTEDEFDALPEKGIEAQKIRALFLAYGGGYDFCRFYRQGSCFLAALDGSFIVCDDGTADPAELADFFLVSGYSDIFCSGAVGTKLAEKLSASFSAVNVMRFDGAASVSCEYDRSPSLSEVYSIISEGFGMEFEPWYLDMSHRVRHGISRCCVLDDKAALVIQHDFNGEALISQVACRKAHRGQGIAAVLVRSVSAELSPSDVYVLCEDALIPFYEKCGFSVTGKKTVITDRST